MLLLLYGLDSAPHRHSGSSEAIEVQCLNKNALLFLMTIYWNPIVIWARRFHFRSGVRHKSFRFLNLWPVNKCQHLLLDIHGQTNAGLPDLCHAWRLQLVSGSQFLWTTWSGLPDETRMFKCLAKKLTLKLKI